MRGPTGTRRSPRSSRDSSRSSSLAQPSAHTPSPRAKQAKVPRAYRRTDAVPPSGREDGLSRSSAQRRVAGGWYLNPPQITPPANAPWQLIDPMAESRIGGAPALHAALRAPVASVNAEAHAASDESKAHAIEHHAGAAAAKDSAMALPLPRTAAPAGEPRAMPRPREAQETGSGFWSVCDTLEVGSRAAAGLNQMIGRLELPQLPHGAAEPAPWQARALSTRLVRHVLPPVEYPVVPSVPWASLRAWQAVVCWRVASVALWAAGEGGRSRADRRRGPGYAAESAQRRAGRAAEAGAKRRAHAARA